MPQITRLASFIFSVENFLDACTPDELKEVDMLIQSNRFRNKMNPKAKKAISLTEESDRTNAVAFEDYFLLGDKKQ